MRALFLLPNQSVAEARLWRLPNHLFSGLAPNRRFSFPLGCNLMPKWWNLSNRKSSAEFRFFLWCQRFPTHHLQGGDRALRLYEPFKFKWRERSMTSVCKRHLDFWRPTKVVCKFLRWECLDSQGCRKLNAGHTYSWLGCSSYSTCRFAGRESLLSRWADAYYGLQSRRSVWVQIHLTAPYKLTVSSSYKSSNHSFRQNHIDYR